MNSIRIRRASEHNLKDISLDIPREAITVFTGVSGSGKSTLAFDTIYREGQRRFLESLSAYARQFLGGFEKPKVELIDGLSPAISIDQKTVGRSPRSTVGTLTEIHDFLRLLFARIGEPHCPSCGKPVASQTAEQICERILKAFPGKAAMICAPVVRGRKGEHRALLEDFKKKGYARILADGELLRLSDGIPELKPRERHTIEIVWDRLKVDPSLKSRWIDGIEKSLLLADGVVSLVVPREESAEVEARELYSSKFACPGCGVDLPEMEPRLFSFNSHHGACPECEGLGLTDQIDPELVVANPSLPLREGGLAIFLPSGKLIDDELDLDGLAALGKRHGFTLRSSWGDLSPEARKAVLEGAGKYEGLLPVLSRAAGRGDAPWAWHLLRKLPCPACGGTRLRAVARAVKVRGIGIHELSAWSVERLEDWFRTLELEGNEIIIAEAIRKNLASRLAYLREVGLSYLTLDRRAETLAGGEAQRLRLASQVGAALQGVLFVLDEPSIGLHARDHARLLEALRRLRDLGNTVLVVEHDGATMKAADHLVDLGPGAGPQGGEVVAQGTALDLAASPGSLTGEYLSGRRSIPVPGKRRAPRQGWIELYGASQNNLKDIDVRIPLGLFVVVTGVSGSGKSSLVNQVLRPAILAKLGHFGASPGKFRSLRGWQHIDKLVEIDQSPIGRTPRSNPCTYVKVFDAVRQLYSRVPEARARGYTAGRFSFNKDEGRCLECGGAGVTLVDLEFLAPVEVPCNACGGRRYNRETLEIHYRGKSVHDVLEMTIGEAAEFFRDHPKIHRPLSTLEKIGLGYMRLGQPSTTLSGGEAQRVKLAAELRKRETGKTLYLFDEPTTGLHFEDIRVFLEAVQELVSRGNSVLVIEHNLDVIKAADHVIDLGPEAGDEGGRVVAEGTPEEVSRVEASHTGRALRSVLGEPEPLRAPEPPRDVSGRDAPGARDLEITGARENNLKGVSVRIPRASITVITGVSGSGKTSLAMDTIFAEGQRRYLESLSTYARRFLGRMRSADVDGITGISPAIAIEEKSASSNPRSTVATITEIHDYLRLLYAKVGIPHCPTCGEKLRWTSPTRLSSDLVREAPGEKVMVLAPLSVAEPAGAESSSLSSGSLLGRVESLRTVLLKSGYTRVLAGGKEIRLDEEGNGPVRRILAEIKGAPPAAAPGPRGGSSLFLVVDRVVAAESAQSRLAGSFEQAFERGSGTAAVLREGRDVELHTRWPSCPAGHTVLKSDLSPSMFSFSSHQGACRRCRGLGIENRIDVDLLFRDPGAPLPAAMDRAVSSFLQAWRPSVLVLLKGLCSYLGIPRDKPWKDLAKEDSHAILHGLGERKVPLLLEGGLKMEAAWPGLIPQIESWLDDIGWGRLPGLEGLYRPQVCGSCGGGRLRPESMAVRVGGLNIQEFSALTVRAARDFLRRLELGPREAAVAEQVVAEMENRLGFLEEVGLHYLTLDRTANTLSGGEAQRIRLASQLGNRLAGVLYVLDEPTVGLHQRDTGRLISSLRELRGHGNTILMIEHDRETMLQADWIIDMGPGAGSRGGRVVAMGTPAEVAACPESLTGRHLATPRCGEVRFRRRAPGPDRIILEEVTHHNLRGIRAEFPLGLFTAVTGVSGSGKSTLVLDVLAEAAEARVSGKPPPAGRLGAARGLEKIRRVVVVDQKPIGRTPRSTPATYTGLWDLVRELYAQVPDSKVKGYGASRFSFNTGEGRCLACQGQGARQIEMHFLPDVWVPCEVCGGRRFDGETLGVRFKGKSVGDVLEMEVEEALGFFEAQPRMRRILETLQAVGLGYVRLGQSADTLSGGEAQRVKIAAELITRQAGGTLYVLDEPTTGLHFEDVRRLLDVLDSLVEGGNTLVVIEHHLDVISAADWVIDLGPEAAEEGGLVVAAGPPEFVAHSPDSATGRYLKEYLSART